MDFSPRLSERDFIITELLYVLTQLEVQIDLLTDPGGVSTAVHEAIDRTLDELLEAANQYQHSYATSLSVQVDDAALPPSANKLDELRERRKRTQLLVAAVPEWSEEVFTLTRDQLSHDKACATRLAEVRAQTG